MLLQTTLVQTCADMLREFEKNEPVTGGERIIFEGVDSRDVYNISAAFADRGSLVIAGRAEGRSTEFSEAVFFRQEGEVWRPHPDYPVYELQDPFITRIKGELIFGGVRVIADPLHPHRIVAWVTEFYRGADIAGLRHFLSGPYNMKDIRLIELASGEIGVLTRPQGYVGGRGQIGFFKVDRLEDVTAYLIGEAPVFKDQFTATQWGGANEAHLLANGLVGVLGHVASFDELDGSRHYYAMTFAINPDTLEKTPMKIIARRESFPQGPAKRPDLVDVIFSGGLVRKSGGRADLYVGAGDSAAYRADIPDPFLEYEQL
ncbi:DUF1861 family protein [Paenibacillus nasutitermitis]|uniref:DUF1861 family protein n=1 Tax=Paenibacillus nasutitermitis TaxID=1652958 RepID=A0A916ZAJ4_9BACL|nr:DUF1861 family protein [Paenibacillus nasutitermitis]GGD83996.1 hypothetical protein GCM10010911_47770 [Paenibacillus nasutitermitis]